MRGWLALAAVLALLSLGETLGARAVADPAAWTGALDWQPGRALAQPWRAWTAAGVHWSTGHLLGNLAAVALVGALGHAARVSGAAALAWCVAWPLTHLLFVPVAAFAPARFAAHLPHYGGLSGVLHAGVVVVGLALWRRGAGRAPADAQAARHERRERLVGLALLAGTAAKVLLEAPWDLALRPDGLLGVGVAPIAHATGMVAGVLAGILVPGITRHLRRR